MEEVSDNLMPQPFYPWGVTTVTSEYLAGRENILLLLEFKLHIVQPVSSSYTNSSACTIYPCQFAVHTYAIC